LETDKSSLVNACVILIGLVMVGVGASTTNVALKISAMLCGVIAILASILGIVNSILSSLGVRLPRAGEDESKRKRRFCPKCLTRVKTVIAPDRSGFRYWCPSCREVVPIPTTSKRLEKLRPPEKRRTFSESE
jgi:hypothetical protein